MIRLFVALELPGWVREWLAAEVESLRRFAPAARWSRAENLHLTLSFMGWVSPDLEGPAREAVRAAGRAHAPFDCRIGRAGAFDSWSRPRVLWVGIEEGQETLERLAEAARAEVRGRGLPSDDRPFLPHLTLCRLDRKPAPGLEAAAAGLAPPDRSWSVDSVALMRSRPSPGGSRYETLHREALAR